MKSISRKKWTKNLYFQHTAEIKQPYTMTEPFLKNSFWISDSRNSTSIENVNTSNFIGYSLRVSRNKASTIFYGTAIPKTQSGFQKTAFPSRFPFPKGATPRLCRHLTYKYFKLLKYYFYNLKIINNLNILYNWQHNLNFWLCHSMRLFHPTVWWKYSLFLQFSPWRNLWLRHFAGYSFETSRKKASTISYDTAFSNHT